MPRRAFHRNAVSFDIIRFGTLVELLCRACKRLSCLRKLASPTVVEKPAWAAHCKTMNPWRIAAHALQTVT